MAAEQEGKGDHNQTVEDMASEKSGLLPVSQLRSGEEDSVARSGKDSLRDPHHVLNTSSDEEDRAELFAAMELELEARAPARSATQPPKSWAGRKLAWVLSFAVPGLGMFTEAYFVFSVGNLIPVFREEFPQCWVTHEECSAALLSSIHYSQVAGIIVGQLALGYLADRVGRKWGSVVTAATMLLGGSLMATASGSSVAALFVMYSISQSIFGVGVGGEYPIASTSASERAEADESLAGKRGETVMLTFSMQGWGNWCNTAVLALLLVAWGQTGKADYDPDMLEKVWRASFALGLVPLVATLGWRLFKLEESTVWAEKHRDQKRQGGAKGFDLWKAGRWVHTYWHRLLGTSACWFAWDLAFYGNRLFQGTFIAIINPDASVVQVLGWTLVNSSVALVGYYASAFTVDKPWMGRRRMQVMGFAMMSLLFMLCAANYRALTHPRMLWLFRLMYYLSSFFGQWGPNATTWLLPSELFPTETRAMSHGLAAACGKLGAVAAGVVFGLVGNVAKFYISAICGLLGAVLTVLFIPDISGLELSEGDRRWALVLEGQGGDYHGPAVAPCNLSLFENLLGIGRAHNANAVQANGLHRRITPEGAPNTHSEFSLSDS